MMETIFREIIAYELAASPQEITIRLEPIPIDSFAPSRMSRVRSGRGMIFCPHENDGSAFSFANLIS